MSKPSLGKKPIVSIVFLTKNAGPSFQQVLQATFKQITPFPYETLAIDSGSTDGTWELLDRFPIRKVRIPPHEFLHGVTRNLAMTQARGKVVVFLVQDALPISRRWLARLVTPLLHQRNGSFVLDTKIAGVTGRQRPPTNLPLPQEYFVQHAHTLSQRPRLLDKVPTEFGPGKIWFSNVCSAINRQAWQKIHFPDVVMSEDQAWTLAVLNKGWALAFEPKAQVIHGHVLSLWSLFKRNVDSGASFAALGTAVPSVGSASNWHWLVDEARFAFKRGGPSGTFYVLIYELTRFLGFQIGYRRFVPWQIKRFFSVVPQWYDHRFH